jgi:GntR family transcriptional regulator
MRVDPNSPVPIFQQIVDGMATAIAAGVYMPGELVPSVRQTAQRLLVNPNTVQRAYEQLERDGLLVAKRGSGMAVADAGPELASDGVLRAVRAKFEQGIDVGLTARLSRSSIEGVYRSAWTNRKPKKEDDR